MSPLRSQPLRPVLACLLLAWSGMVLWSYVLPEVVRPVVLVTYLLLAPGLAIVPSFGRPHWLFHLLLVLSLSVALATAVSTAMGVAGWWRVDVAVSATVALVTSVVTWRFWRDRTSGVSSRAGALR